MEVPFDAEVGVSVSLKNFSFSVHDTESNATKQILHDVSFAAEPGELLAILGPSGCGKTTLLNCIARRTKGNETGEVHFNGRSLTRTELLNEELLAYVMSKDKHLEFLTVEESLYYAAKLKMKDATDEERNNRIESMILAMDLTPCRKTLIGGTWSKGLSTGEMRRVSIAIELLDNPAVLLLDEPTTGLDSTRAAGLMPVLKNLAVDSRKNIIMTIHQPSSNVFANFDKILIMSKGRVICGGPAASAMSYVNSRFLTMGRQPYLKPCNPADFLLDLVSAVPDSKTVDPADTRIRLTESELEEWAVAYRQSALVSAMMDKHEKNRETPLKLRGLKPSGCGRWWTAFGVLYCRMSLNSIRNPAETVILAGAQLILTTWLGLIFYQSCGEPEASKWGATVTYMDELFGYLIGEHSLSQALQDEWAAHSISDGSAIPTVPPGLMDSVTITGTEHQYFDYGNGLTPDLLEKTYTTPDIVYDLNDFPLAIPSTVQGGLDVLSCIRTNLGSLSYLPYEELFSEAHYPHWEFNEIPTSIQASIDNMADIENARDVMQLAYRAVALGDFAWNHISWDDLPDYNLYDAEGNLSPWIRTSLGTEEKADAIGVGVPFWLKVMACYGDELNAMLGCMNFPKLPNLRDQPLIALIGLDVSCNKPLPEASLRRLFGNELNSIEAFIPYQKFQKEERFRRLEALNLDVTNPDYSADFRSWLNEFMNLSKACTHETCQAVQTIVDDVVTDLGGAVAPVLTELHIGGMMMFLAGFIQFASFDAILTFQQERIIFNRETNNQMYPTSSFFIAKNCAAIPFQYFHTSLGFITLYFLAGIEASVFFWFYAMAVAVVWAMYGFNFFFSACSKTLEMAIYMVPTMVITMMVTSGFFVRESTFPKIIGWTKYFSCTRWAFHGFNLIYFPRGEQFAGMPTEVALGLFGVSTQNAETCFMALGIIGLLYRVAAFVVLKYFHRKVGLES